MGLGFGRKTFTMSVEGVKVHSFFLNLPGRPYTVKCGGKAPHVPFLPSLYLALTRCTLEDGVFGAPRAMRGSHYSIYVPKACT